MSSDYGPKDSQSDGGASPIRLVDNQWIPLRDGAQLAARIWMPALNDNEALPAVLEFLPYRKRNGTSKRDEVTYPAFAAAGIVGVRVDIRGSGESDGVIDGEYTVRELSDAVEVIEWIASQSWSNGNVGMMGISWGGFNALQVAALKPPALKAVISLSSTVDRYNDDVHYKNGTHLSAQFSWAAYMLALQALPPDPQLVGERWRDMWLQRLEDEPFFLKDWLSHQCRDEFWQHGSIAENFEDIKIPVLVIAGWADGYRNTPLKVVTGMPDNTIALIGPWVHLYPHLASPRPSADFIQEAIGWWNHWLRGEENDVGKTPQVRAFVIDGLRPGNPGDHAPGFWVAKSRWKPPQYRLLILDENEQLSEEPYGRSNRRLSIRSPLDTGIAGGEWWASSTYGQLPGDQRVDEGGSLVFENDALNIPCTLLGMPKLQLTLSSDSPLANIAVRLIDVHPDGVETRVSYAVLNLAHRESNAEPKFLIPGKDERIEIILDACGYRFGPGHRIKLAISTAYWPLIFPPPFYATLNIDTSSIRLMLPLLGDHELIDVAEPTNLNPLPSYESLSSGKWKRWIERDIVKGLTHYRAVSASGLSRHPDNGLVQGGEFNETWTISEHDPLSMQGECHSTSKLSRDDWQVLLTCVSTISCTKTYWAITESIDARCNGVKFFSRARNEKIPRDFM